VEGPPQRQDQVLIPQDLTEAFEPIVGTSVTLRPLRPEDAEIETAFVSGLSAETRSNRLLGGSIRITREYIAKLTSVDYSRDMALAATVMLGGEETLIGVARYVLDADGKGCEFAIVVADAWQGRGIGKRMLAKLVAVAQLRKIPRIYGDILATNRGMLEMVKKVGFSIERNPDDATVVRATREL
jgi:acetyltransferase